MVLTPNTNSVFVTKRTVTAPVKIRTCFARVKGLDLIDLYFGRVKGLDLIDFDRNDC